jgi:hypothetical protein
MNLQKCLKDDYVHWLLGSGLVSIYAIGHTVLTGHYFDEGWLHPLLILGIISGLFSFSLSLRKEWSRWLGICFLALIVVFFIWKLLYFRFSMIHVLGLVCTLLSIWQLRFLPITQVQKMLNDPEIMAQLMDAKEHALEEFASYKHWKIDILFRSAPQIDINKLAQIVEKVFDLQFAVKPGILDPVDASFLPAEHPSPFVAGEPPILLCYNPPALLSLYEIRGEYPTELFDKNSLPYSLKELASNHHAWIEIEILPYVGNSTPVDNGYVFSGKIAGELMDENVVAVLLPDRKQWFPYSVELRDALINSDPCQALDCLSCNRNE